MTIVRAATHADAGAAIAVVRRSIEELCVADHRGDPATLARWLANKTPANFEGWIADPDNYCVVAETGTGMAGVGLLHRSGGLRLVYLAPGLQRRGIGTAIHAELEAAARRMGLRALHLKSTALARPFYEALGYRAAGPAQVRYGVQQCFPYEKPL